MEEDERAAEEAARAIVESTPSVDAMETVLPPTPGAGNDVEMRMSPSISEVNKEADSAEDNVESAEDDIESDSVVAAIASLSVESSPASPVPMELALPPAIARCSPDAMDEAGFVGSDDATGDALASLSISGGTHISMYTRHSMHDLHQEKPDLLNWSF